ncbi:hypothetical protein N9164_12875, partial [Draconibacterium sp.]|nr:hypothetical protein [Draconibacterium sp.]
ILIGNEVVVCRHFCFKGNKYCNLTFDELSIQSTTSLPLVANEGQEKLWEGIRIDLRFKCIYPLCTPG